MAITEPRDPSEPPVPMFEFRAAPQQEVSLPDGRLWTVRVERDTEPHWNGGLFSLNGWYWRWLLSRLRFALRPAARQKWRVVIVPDAVVTSQELAFAPTAMLLTPAIGKPIHTRSFASREEAEQWAALAYDGLRVSGALPAAQAGS